MSNRCRPMRGSFWSAWRSPMWTRSTASRRRSPSGRRTPRAIRARPSPPPPNCTTFCACCGRARAGPIARTAASQVRARHRRSGRRAGCWRSRKARAGTRCFPIRRTETRYADALRDRLFDLRKQGFNRLYQGGTHLRILDARIAARYRFHEAGLRPGGPPGDRRRTCASASSTRSRSAIAKPAK